MPENDSGADPIRGGLTASSSRTTSTLSVRGTRSSHQQRLKIADYLEDFTRRIVLDALNEGTARYWHDRARSFEAARCRPGDFVGGATADELGARDGVLREIAQACSARAQVAVLSCEDVIW